MAHVKDERELYLARFAELEKNARRNGSAWTAPLRKQAIDRFGELGFPTTRDEAWKYLDVSPITQKVFEYVPRGRSARLTRKEFEGCLVPDLDCYRLVFVDGHYDAELSSLDGLPAGLVLMDLATAVQSRRQTVESHLAQVASYQGQAFVALNTAFIEDGAFVHVARNCVVDKPVHLMFVSGRSSSAVVTHPRTLVLLEESAQLDLVEDYVGIGEGEYFTNPVTEMVLEKNSNLHFHKFQRESIKAYHVAAIDVHQQRDSQFTANSISVGGRILRNDLRTLLDGEGAFCCLNGLNVLRGEQVADDHTRIAHARPHCISEEQYKSILDDEAQGVFNGEVLVAKDAQKSNSQQSSKNLLLSRRALMNTKPELKIYADDVKCSHGATVGQLDQEALFYLRSRGIDLEAARDILVHAFGSDVVHRIQIEPLRRALEVMLFPASVFEPSNPGHRAEGDHR